MCKYINIFIYFIISIMEKILNNSEEVGRNAILSKNMQNFKKLLSICKECSKILMLCGEEMFENLGNTYQPLFQSYTETYSERNPDNEEDFNKVCIDIQNFLIEVSKIFDEKVKPEEKWKNQVIDWFVKEVFKLNDLFCDLNKKIREQEEGSILYSLYEKNDHFSGLNAVETYNITKDLYSAEWDNKRLWIFVYYSLLKMVDEEYRSLLGDVDEKKILKKEEFEEKIKNLFIGDFLGVKTYNSFCDNYDILKNKQIKLSEMKQKIGEMFDKEWNLKSGLYFRNLYMKNLKSFLDVYPCDSISYVVWEKVPDWLSQKYSQIKNVTRRAVKWLFGKKND